ncbi:MAG: MFS transporter [Candidatus Bipolaricaulaceae bacterium]
MSPHPEKKRVWPVALAHGLNDGYGAFLSALLPLLIERLGISLTLAGLLTSVRSSPASFGQWPLGLAVDRFGPRVFALLGPALTVTAMGLLGVAPSYTAAALLLVLAGLGTAAFHPAGACLVPEGGSRGLRMALFAAGGTLGVALGPLLVTQTVSRFGLSRVPFLLVPAALLLGLIGFALPRGARPNRQAVGFARHPQRHQVLRLWGMGMFRDVVGTAVSGFLAVVWARRGASLTLAGLSLTVYALAGALGDLVGGRLSDRFGRREILAGALLLALPSLYLFLFTQGAVSLAFLAFFGFASAASVPVAVVYGQELMPESRGLVAGLLLGLAWGVGSLLVTGVGALADRIGLEPALGLVGLALLPAAALALSLPKR